jgi:hypothetical protein
LKIALIGSAPSSIRLAPYDDPSWQIWGCSPGAYAVVKRSDAWFELHRWEPPVIGDAERQVPWFSPEYVQWMALHKGPVYMSDVVAQVPHSVRYPIEKMLEKYGPYFFNSSLSFMMALALEQPGIEEIGLWGVDMSATEEYGYQRAGCHFFITEAARRGIRVTVPPESDLLQPKPIYGAGESTPMMVKLTSRMRELDSRIAAAQQRINQGQQELMFLQGAKDDLTYVIQTWTGQATIDRLFKLAPPAPTVKVD